MTKFDETIEIIKVLPQEDRHSHFIILPFILEKKDGFT